MTAHEPYAGDVTMRSTAWHPEFEDVNNDGFIDLFVSKGNVEAIADYAARDPNNLLIGQADGTFAEGGDEAGIGTFLRARGAALADLNLDGLLDLVVVNRREPVQLWRNVGGGEASAPAPMGNWLAVGLEQPGANRNAIGACDRGACRGPRLGPRAHRRWRTRVRAARLVALRPRRGRPCRDPRHVA